MEIGYQITITVVVIGILLLTLFFVRKYSEKIKRLRKTNSLLEVKEAIRIDANNKLFLIGVAGQEFLIISSKNGHNIIRVTR
ncbi:MAG: hypothetical protein CMM44_06115 [Rhodospirillaceae bacterium]|nr:hypothetical protein [Rhodospirillaceae bacterium]|tara:strand:+ start:3090 stop:3335 length:246 start_codon:yes stop_codon:yes gene_type:complete